MIGALLLEGCKGIEDPIRACIVNDNFGAECGLKDLNYKNRSIGDFIGETKLYPISKARDYVCFHGKDWSVIMKPALKELNTKYRQKKRKR